MLGPCPRLRLFRRRIVPSRHGAELSLRCAASLLEIELADITERLAPLCMAHPVLDDEGALAAGPNPNSEPWQCGIPFDVIALACRKLEGSDRGFGQLHD